MSDERFKEIFRRLTSETPDPPAFSDLETHRAKPAAPIRLKPWMAAAGAAALVLVVVGAFGLLGGGGPDLAAPDENTIDYVKLEYSATVNPVCEGGEIIDNGGFDEATIEIWGPNSDDLTLMVATFPDGSTERMITEGEDLFNPERAWGIDPASFEEETGFRSVRCSNTPGGEIESFGFLNPPYQPGLAPVVYLRPPPGYETWHEALDYVTTLSELNGNAVTIHSWSETIPPNGEYHIEFYVSVEEPDRLLAHRYEWTKPEQGSLSTEMTVIDLKTVEASSVSFSTQGLFYIAKPGEEILDEGEIPADCRVTIPSQGITPPDGYPATPTDPDSVWFGKAGLWTALSPDGTHDPRKSVWWSVNFPGGSVEPEPELKVRYTLLNSPRSLTFETTAATNAYTEADGWFIIAGIDTRYSGCWEVTAIYKDASLSYVYYNPDGANPEPIVPHVVGMTVERAGNVLQDAGYEATYSAGIRDVDVVCAQDPAPGTQLNPGGSVPVKLDAAPEGECPEPMTPSLGFNADFEIYSDEAGRIWYSTACMNADVLIEVGEDGDTRFLPMVGQTTSDKVEAAVVLARSVSESDDAGYLLGRPGVLDIRAVPRNGEVWEHDSGGHTIVTLVQDFMIEAVIDSWTFVCPGIPASYDGIPIAFVREDISCHDEVTERGESITVFFNCGDGPDPNPTPLYRKVGETTDVLTTTFGHLVVGPSFIDSELGFNSLFGMETATSVVNAEIVGSQLTVHFNESIMANNASTATGSTFFLAELYATAFQFEDVESVEFRVNGSCEAFWEFLQAGPVCNVLDRAGWEEMQSQWENG